MTALTPPLPLLLLTPNRLPQSAVIIPPPLRAPRGYRRIPGPRRRGASADKGADKGAAAARGGCREGGCGGGGEAVRWVWYCGVLWQGVSGGGVEGA